MGRPTRRPKMKRYMFSLPTSLSMFTLEAVGAEVIEAMFAVEHGLDTPSKHGVDRGARLHRGQRPHAERRVLGASEATEAASMTPASPRLVYTESRK